MSEYGYDLNARYRFARRDHWLRGKEFVLLKRISRAIDERVGARASTAERIEACREMVKEDEGFAGLVECLREWSESDPTSLLGGLVAQAREETLAGDGPVVEGKAADPPESTLRVAAKALEEHETELVDRLIELAPPDGGSRPGWQRGRSSGHRGRRGSR